MKKFYFFIPIRIIIVCTFTLCAVIQLKAQCAATNVPYTEDFESATTPSVPACTSVENPGTGSTWFTDTNPWSGFTTNALSYISNGGTVDTWFYTMGLNLTAGTSYRLTYKYAVYYSFLSENMKVNYGTSATASAMTTTLTNHFNFSNDFVVTQTVDFIPAATGVYYIGFNAYSDPNTAGILVDDITVNLSPSCVEPVTVNLTGLNATNASLSWTGGSVSPSWDVYYGASPLPAPSASTVPTATTSTSSYSLTGLTASTAYEVYVRSHCSATDQSFWTPAPSFTTPCVATSIPYTQDFESASPPSFPVCTSAESPVGSPWQLFNSPGSGFTTNTLIYFAPSPNAANAWFYNQGLSLTGGTSYRLTYRYACYDPSTPENMEVNYGNALLTSAMTHTLTNHFHFSNDYSITQTVDFTPATTGIYYIGFHCYSDPYTSAVFVDDITVNLTPTCVEPVTVNLNSLYATSASISWTGGSASPSWDVYYGPSPLAAPSASTIPTATTSSASYTMSGLSVTTAYNMYVRAHCSATDQSFWVPANTFTTPCLAVNIPYTQDFESATIPSVPGCTSTENFGSGNTWITTNNPGHGFTTKTLDYAYTFYTANTWFYTQGLNLTAGISYRLTYRYGNNGGGSYPERLNVNYGSSSTAIAMTHTLTNHVDFVNDYSVTQTVDFTPTSTGVYYVGFHAYSVANMDNIFVDDITVNISPTCLEPTTLNLAALTANSASINWTGGSASPSWDVYYGTSPLTAPSASTVPTATTSTSSYSLAGLTASTAYGVYVRAHCSATDQSSWVPLSFTTACTPITILPFTEGFEGVTTPDAPACWTVINGNGDVYQWGSVSGSSSAHSGTTYMGLYTNNMGGAVNEWLMTPNIVLNGNQQLKYWIKSQDASDPNNYTVKLSTNGILTSAFTHTLLPLTTVSNDTYVQNIINLSAYSGSTVAIAFQVPPGTLDGWFLSLDDITIEDVPVCNPPSALTVTNTTGTSTKLSWTIPSGGTPVNYGYEVRTSGVAGSGTLGLSSSGTVAVPTNSILVTGLNPGTIYQAYIRSDCGSGNFSTWSPAQSLTTASCMTLVAVSSSSAICIGQSAVLTASTTATASYTWSANAGSATTASVSVSPTVTTVYTLTAVSGTCTATSTVNIVVDCTVGMEELNAAGIKLMPNPNNGQVIISLPTTLSGNTILEIYNAIGQLVMKHPLSASDNLIITAPLERGLYLYRIYNNNSIIKTGKMIRE